MGLLSLQHGMRQTPRPKSMPTLDPLKLANALPATPMLRM